jgi:hypothetical protein
MKWKIIFLMLVQIMLARGYTQILGVNEMNRKEAIVQNHVKEVFVYTGVDSSIYDVYRYDSIGNLMLEKTYFGKKIEYQVKYIYEGKRLVKEIWWERKGGILQHDGGLLYDYPDSLHTYIIAADNQHWLNYFGKLSSSLSDTVDLFTNHRYLEKGKFTFQLCSNISPRIMKRRTYMENKITWDYMVMYDVGKLEYFDAADSVSWVESADSLVMNTQQGKTVFNFDANGNLVRQYRDVFYLDPAEWRGTYINNLLQTTTNQNLKTKNTETHYFKYTYFNP